MLTFLLQLLGTILLGLGLLFAARRFTGAGGASEKAPRDGSSGGVSAPVAASAPAPAQASVAARAPTPVPSTGTPAAKSGCCGGAGGESCACSSESAAAGSGGCCKSEEGKVEAVPLRILYASQTGRAKAFAEQLRKDAFAMNVNSFHFDVTVVSLDQYDPDNLEQETLVLFLMPTWTDGTASPTGQVFMDWLHDLAIDFRVPRIFLSKVHFAVFGLGNGYYDENFNAAAKQLNHDLEELGAKAAAPLGLGDDSVDMEAMFAEWKNRMWPAMCAQYAAIKGIDEQLAAAAAGAGCGSGSCGASVSSSQAYRSKVSWEEGEANSKQWLPRKEHHRRLRAAKVAAASAAGGGDDDEDLGNEDDMDGESEGPVVPNDEDLANDAILAYMSSDEEDAGPSHASVTTGSVAGDGDSEMVDVEDLAAAMSKSATVNSSLLPTGLEMVTPAQRRALTKEGYKIIGTHSAVKLCRWTKHHLRGRGGCYKHTCYGITSYQCMETTPSLACANKCVFCWRHHKNPVGREWRWKTDSPEAIVTEAIEKHQNLIKQLKGVPGVRMDRWHAAFTVQHCALSLVGEPIMYPHINELLKLLHDRKISTFLVTNAQFPEQIETLQPVTQLYVSIDAATRDTLRAIDRPLFKDFWERFLGSLDQLRNKKQRTVYRMTLVKSWNMTEVADYASLIARGSPDFIEIKAVTYCGKSDGSSLTMANVPYHTEVRTYSEAICAQLGGEYEIACEHAHSCLVLLAKKQFKVNGVWHTWIDYPRFHQLMARYYETGESFTSMDYIAPTPEWAVYNATEAGFDPEEVRFKRSSTGTVVEIPYRASSSGCG